MLIWKLTVGLTAKFESVTRTVTRRLPANVMPLTTGLDSISQRRWNSMIPEPDGAAVVAVVSTYPVALCITFEYVVVVPLLLAIVSETYPFVFDKLTSSL